MKPNIQNILLGMIVIVLMIIAIILVRRPAQAPVIPMYNYGDTSHGQNTTPQTNISNETTTTPTSTSKGPEWEKLTSADFIKIITTQEPTAWFEKDFGLSLSKTIDLTGDGVPEAIVDGNGGNNGVSFILQKNSNGTISVLNQKNKDGTINHIQLVFVGRVMVSERFELLPQERGFYTASLSNDGEEGVFRCNDVGVNAYVWNASTKLFEWNQSLTSKYTLQVCK